MALNIQAQIGAAFAKGRQAEGQLFNRSCSILRKGTVLDAYGRPAPGAEVVFGAFLPCSVAKGLGRSSGRELELAGRPVDTNEWRVFVPLETAIIPSTDRLRVYDLDASGNRTGTGIIYDVTGTNAGASHVFVLTCFCKTEGGD